MTSAKDVARDIYINVRHEEWGVDSVEEAVKDAIKQARVKALEDAKDAVRSVIPVAFLTEGMEVAGIFGEAIERIGALAETKQENDRGT